MKKTKDILGKFYRKGFKFEKNEDFIKENSEELLNDLDLRHKSIAMVTMPKQPENKPLKYKKVNTRKEENFEIKKMREWYNICNDYNNSLSIVSKRDLKCEMKKLKHEIKWRKYVVKSISHSENRIELLNDIEYRTVMLEAYKHDLNVIRFGFIHEAMKAISKIFKTKTKKGDKKCQK